jgi:hypothetical protein
MRWQGFRYPQILVTRPRILNVISLGKDKYRFPAVRKGKVRTGGSDVAVHEPQA